MRNPFVKFISHSASYMFFLMLLALSSQRVEYMALSLLCFLFPEIEILSQTKNNWEKYDRGSIPRPVELLVILWVQGYVWVEVKALWKDGLLEYMKDLWNLADLFCIGAFMNWVGLRVIAFLLVQKEQWEGVDPDEIWTPREEWGTLEPMLLADAMFGAGMIASYLKVVQIFSINPYLGPLQIAIGKMILDIIKWLCLYILVVFAFGCGMNQLMWYYADLEKQECYQLPGGEPDFENAPDSCVTWRRFANLWETSQSLFWASFGLVELGDFDLKGIGEFTRFWGLLMFGSYCVCNIIVLLNMLIAMMSNSYQIIYEKSDREWKFSRSKLWISYFDAGSTVPVPFNLIPSPKAFVKLLCCRKTATKICTEEEKKEAETRYSNVMKFIIRRYITNEQRKSEDFSITEDDINEVRQDINSFKFELLDILKKNNWNVPNQKRGAGVLGRKSKNMERQIQKGFQITKIDGVMEAFFGASFDMKDMAEVKPKDLFKKIAKRAAQKATKTELRRSSRASLNRSSIKRDQIGSTENSIKRHRHSLKKSLLNRGSSQAEIRIMLNRLNSQELVAFNPLLADHTPATRRAYAKFKSALQDYNEKNDKSKADFKEEPEQTRNLKSALSTRDSIKKIIKQASVDNKQGEQQTIINKNIADEKKSVPDIKSDPTVDTSENVTEDSVNPQRSCTGKKDVTTLREEKELDNSLTPRKEVDSLPGVKEITTSTKSEKEQTDRKDNMNGRENSSNVGEVSRPEQVATKIIDKDENVESSQKSDQDEGCVNNAFVKDEAPSKDGGKIDKEQEKMIPEEDIQFDPEGRSAISGQKRTGWI